MLGQNGFFAKGVNPLLLNFKKKGFAPLILFFIAAVCLLGFTAYNLGKNGIKMSPKMEDKQQIAINSPKPLNIVIPSGWKAYHGETFAIGYPQEWLLQDNTLYLDGKADISMPYIVLGVGGHGVGETGKPMKFTSGDALYWRFENDNKLSLITMFAKDNASYTFEGENLRPEHEQIFLKMMNTFSY